ncbi:hypothetical protein ACFWWB_25680 [Streptomyces sp. NPDC058690]
MVPPDRPYSSISCGRTVDALLHCTTCLHPYRCGGDELTEHVPVE